MVNNTKVECEDEGRPYDMKLCFSRANTKLIEKADNEEEALTHMK